MCHHDGPSPAVAGVGEEMLGIVVEIKKILRITKINLWSLLATRGECIFIPLNIAMRKRCKNAVGGVVLAVIQITDDRVPNGRLLRVQHTYGAATSPPS